MRHTRTLLRLGLLLAVAATARAADPDGADEPAKEPGPFDDIQLGVALEGYYEYNANRPYDEINLLRAYDTRANMFGLQQAALVFELAPDVPAGRRFGGRVDLQYGQATATLQGSAANEPRPEVYRNLWQAFGTYVFPVGRGLRMDFGKFGSNLGIETNYAKDNHHFSRGYLFNFLPFYHAGLRLGVPVSERVTLMYMLTNGLQQTEDFNDVPSHHFSAVGTHGKFSWTGSYYFGREQPQGDAPDPPSGQFRVYDGYFTCAVTPRLDLGLDVNYVTNEIGPAGSALSLQGLGAYARYEMTKAAAVALRYERLDDEGLFGNIEQVLEELTATVEYAFGRGFLLRGELRRDWSNEDFFTTSRPGDLRDHQETALAGFVWWFGNKQGAW
jgi:hypothetical protein